MPEGCQSFSARIPLDETQHLLADQVLRVHGNHVFYSKIHCQHTLQIMHPDVIF